MELGSESPRGSDTSTDDAGVSPDNANVRFGCGLIVLAPLVWFAVLAGAFASQSMFFGIETYLSGSDVTTAMPGFLRAFVLVTTVIGGLGGRYGPYLSAGVGVLMLLMHVHGGKLSRIGIVILLIPLIAIILHNTILTIAFIVQSGGFPPQADLIPLLLGLYLFTTAAMVAYWWRLRKRWPTWAVREKVADGEAEHAQDSGTRRDGGQS